MVYELDGLVGFLVVSVFDLVLGATQQPGTFITLIASSSFILSKLINEEILLNIKSLKIFPPFTEI